MSSQQDRRSGKGVRVCASESRPAARADLTSSLTIRPTEGKADGSAAHTDTVGTLTLGSLFTGAAGLDRAVVNVLGAVPVWLSEYEPPTEKNPRPSQAAARLLAYRFPDVPNLGDITKVDWRAIRRPDVICAGYPCQPDSLAGKGLSTDDDRYLWPEVARAIGILGPRLVMLENVYGHLVRGFAGVVGSLADLGYDTSWTTLRASDVGAPHKRERLFAAAWPADTDGTGWWDAISATSRRRQTQSTREGSDARRGDRRTPTYPGRDAGWLQPVAESWCGDQTDSGLDREATADTTRDRRDEGRTEPARIVRGSDAAERRPHAATDTDGYGFAQLGRELASQRDLDRRSREAVAWGRYEPAIRRWETVLGRPAPTPTQRAPQGGQRLSPRFVEWLMGWPDGWVTDVPGISRNDQLKICGNGVVTLQAEAALRLLLADADGEAAA